jgi:hypothetical protein
MFARPNVLPTASAPLTPFFAALTGSLQLIENQATLSPAFATLTHFVTVKSFVCHSYKKAPGVGDTPLPPLTLEAGLPKQKGPSSRDGGAGRGGFAW